MALTLSDIGTVLSRQGDRQYGREAVSQLDHALQCAGLAEQAGETPETVVAALLHDLGHLLAPAAAHAASEGDKADDLHQYVALPFLRGLFPAGVLEPIRLHVDAKRYLCAIDPGYWATLSPVSQQSLVVQGGAYTTAQALEFARQPFAQEAIRLRRYDDCAKVPGRQVPPLEHFMAIASGVAAARA